MPSCVAAMDRGSALRTLRSRGRMARMKMLVEAVFTPGTTFMGVDLAAWLDKHANGNS